MAVSGTDRPKAPPWFDRLLWGGAVAVLIVALLFMVGPGQPTLPGVDAGLWLTRLQTLATVFLGILIEALPFLLLGVLASAAARVFFGEDRLARGWPRWPWLSAALGGLGGTVFPLCECGAVPLTRRLFQRGLPLPAGVAFLLAAPVVNPVVLFATVLAFGGDWSIAGWRLGLTFLIAVVIGGLFGRLKRSPLRPLPPLPSAPPGPLADRLGAVLLHASDEFLEMGRYLAIGAFIAAALQTFVPRSGLLAVGQGPITSVLILMALAALLNLCSMVDAFVVLALVSTFTPGAIVAFLVFGPLVDVKSTLMYWSTFRRGPALALVGLCAAGAFLAGVGLNLALGRF